MVQCRHGRRRNPDDAALGQVSGVLRESMKEATGTPSAEVGAIAPAVYARLVPNATAAAVINPGGAYAHLSQPRGRGSRRVR